MFNSRKFLIVSKTMDEIEAHKDVNSKKVEIYDDNIRNEC
jgi:hypothetical protein